ncbi:MAG: hypothetical protein K9K35_07650 [Rhodoferax sp.]|nr:hypothetical protein [Rhodoferax sp.]
MFLNTRELPTCMLELGDTTLGKAIEIANALRSVGVEEGKTLRIAVATAKHLERKSMWVPPDDDY